MEAILAILREHGFRGETAITPELREHLGCAQIQLESGFVEAKPLPYQVLVRRIDLDPQRLTEPSQGIRQVLATKLLPCHIRFGTARNSAVLTCPVSEM